MDSGIAAEPGKLTFGVITGLLPDQIGRFLQGHATGKVVQQLFITDGLGPGAGEPAAPDTPAEALPEMGVDADATQGEAPSGDTTGQTLLNDFRAQLEADSSASAQQIADTLLSNPVIQFAGASMPVEPGLLMGFGNAEIQGFKEGVMFAPAIGSIAFVGYVFVLEDGIDAASFVQTLLDNADPRWNICVEAEETVADYVGSTVFFLMCP